MIQPGDDGQTIAERASVSSGGLDQEVFTPEADQAAPMPLDILPSGMVINSAPPLEQKTPQDN